MILPFLIAWFATKINYHQGHVIAYLREENRILKAKLKGKRIHLTDVERRCLALLAHPIDRKDLNDISTIATADTLQRWYRHLVVPSLSSTLRNKRLGRPRVAVEIEQLVVCMAIENPRWGYRRIQGALSNLGYHINKTTVRNILRRHDIDPAPIRGNAGTSWSKFIKLHFEVLEASGFFAVGWSPIESVSAIVIQIGRRLCAQGSPPLSLIRHSTACLPALVLQRWYTCWSAC